MAKYHIAIVHPEGYQHSDCFREVAESLRSALHSLGHEAAIGENTMDAQATNIVLGVHLLGEAEAAMLLPGSIVFNLEKLSSPSLPAWYMGLAARHRIWEYSAAQMKRWEAIAGQEAPVLVAIGFAPELRRIAPVAVEDIDVLFYGSLNERRSRVLRALEAAGMRVHACFGVYGRERDALIARSRLVLNLHMEPDDPFEIVRVSYLLANARAVVAEASADMGELAEAVSAHPYEELVAACRNLLDAEAARQALAARGAAIFARRSQAELLRDALAAIEASRPAFDFPRRLNLGSGKDWRPDWLNIDINDQWRPDAVLDVSQPLAETFDLPTERFGLVRVGPGCFDEIVANDVLEHIPNLTGAMTAALRLLRVGGRFHIHVPYDLSLGAWQDPTHVRAFNERSWLYYTDWFWYLGWREARFSIDRLEFKLSPAGEAMRGRCSSEEIMRTPRAVESMQITLRKQALSREESRTVENFLKRPERRPVAAQEAGGHARPTAKQRPGYGSADTPSAATGVVAVFAGALPGGA